VNLDDNLHASLLSTKLTNLIPSKILSFNSVWFREWQIGWWPLGLENDFSCSQRLLGKSGFNQEHFCPPSMISIQELIHDLSFDLPVRLQNYFENPTTDAVSHVYNMALGSNGSFFIAYRKKNGLRSRCENSALFPNLSSFLNRDQPEQSCQWVSLSGSSLKNVMYSICMSH
jgi:hypothetical protein